LIITSLTCPTASDDRKITQKAGGKGSPDKNDLKSKTKNKLYEEAKSLHIEGRSKMSKKELIESIVFLKGTTETDESR